MSSHRTGLSQLPKILAVLTLTGGLTVGAISTAGPATAAGTTAITLTATNDPTNAQISGNNQGFSVESADFAHGYLTMARMSQRLQTLGEHGVIRIGGYSMDLVWPTFGAYRNAPAPAQAIGGVVDQRDLDQLKRLTDDSGWQVTLAVPLKAVIDQAKLKDPNKDPAPPVTMAQAVAEVKAAHKTLGDDLLAVEVGNEFDNVTTLTSAEYYATLKQYQAAITAAVPDVHIKMVGPSANTSSTNNFLNDFVTAVASDTTTTPSQTLEELSSHFYPGSHCGTSTLKLATLTSDVTYLKTRAKLQGVVDVGARLDNKVPSVMNESNSASCSGQPGVSNAYASSLWSLDYLLQAAQTGISRVQFHTNTAAICGDFKARTSPDYPISYRYYGAFCAADQAAFDANELSASPLYYGIWAFRQIPQGTFADLNLADTDLSKLRAYAVQGRNGKFYVVLVNVQDPSIAESTDDAVTLNLPSAYSKGRAVTLQSSAAGGLGSLDASAITLGGRTVTPAGVPAGTSMPSTVEVSGTSSTVTVAAGTAQIITFSH
ncbi:MAG: glycosyl hydrolase family 79 C-terminal domain-containing protein [Pseudonocardiales bacterium]